MIGINLFDQPGRATPCVKIGFMGGDDIFASCVHAVRIAKLLDCMVTFDFNGVHCMARPNTDPKSLAERWNEELQKPAGAYKVAA